MFLGYYRFAQMLANVGELNGVRILAPVTLKLMTSNHVPQELLIGQFGIAMHAMRPGFGYGYNCAVIFDPPEANLPDGKGTFFWAGTWFWVDPTNDIGKTEAAEAWSRRPKTLKTTTRQRSIDVLQYRGSSTQIGLFGRGERS